MGRSFAIGLLSLVSVAILTVGGCSSSSSSTGSNSMTAIVGSENWSATTVEATNTNNVIVIGGLNANGTIQIRLQTYGVNQPGAVQIATGQPHMAILYEHGMLYSANAIVGSGMITFNKLTSQEAEGTFSFTAINNDKQQSRSVSNGKFSVRFK